MNSKHRKLIALDVLFVSIIMAISYIKGEIAIPEWYMFGLMCLATMRLAQTVSFNEIAEPLREPFCEVTKDSCGAGENVSSKNGSVIGSLLACPICTGTWAALALYTVYLVVPTVGTVLVYVLAMAAGSQLLHYVSECLSWAGRLFRVLSGAVSPDEGVI